MGLGVLEEIWCQDTTGSTVLYTCLAGMAMGQISQQGLFDLSCYEDISMDGRECQPESVRSHPVGAKNLVTSELANVWKDPIQQIFTGLRSVLAGSRAVDRTFEMRLGCAGVSHREIWPRKTLPE